MVAIVAGNGLGLNMSSVLGSAGVLGLSNLGRGSDQAYVNAANGNLVVQARDELLVGRGPDALALRTYNSQGLLAGDNWLTGVSRQVYPYTGTPNAAGSTVTRRGEDGVET